jgi:hypothetical protein
MKFRRALLVLAGSVMLLLGFMIDRVDLEGSHTSYLVIAPHPTFRFRYSGGEEGSWRRANPHEAAPWWVAGRYVVLMEVTDS